MSLYYPYGGSGGGGGSSSAPQPDYGAALANIKTMTSQELRDLLEDEDKCDVFVKSLQQVRRK